MPTPEINQVSGAVIDAALKVHTHFGPGLLEKVYKVSLAHELTSRGIDVATEVPLPVVYDNVSMDAGYFMDLVVADQVVVELKTVDKFHPLHTSQLLTYLRLSGHRLGLLMNFNVSRLKDGIKRIAL